MVHAPQMCPDEETLAAVVEGTASEGIRTNVLTHLGECRECMLAVGHVMSGGVAQGALEDVTRGLSLWADRYTLRTLIGLGASAAVYRAYDERLQRDVALKVFRSQALNVRAEREAQSLAKLRHPHVVAVYDGGHDHGLSYLTMHLVAGQNLRQWLAQSPSLHERLRVLHEAAQGLMAAHQEGVVHRDFKPENVLIQHDGVAYVADFGLARPEKHAMGQPESTQGRLTLGSVGTPAYMPPEQHLGAANPKVDVFSFAVTAVEVLTGHRPEHDEGVWKPIAWAAVPRPVRAALQHALVLDARHREASLLPLMRALQRARRARRTRPLGLAAVTLTCAAVGTWATMWPQPSAFVQRYCGHDAAMDIDAWAPASLGVRTFNEPPSPIWNEIWDDDAQSLLAAAWNETFTRYRTRVGEVEAARKQACITPTERAQTCVTTHLWAIERVREGLENREFRTQLAGWAWPSPQSCMREDSNPQLLATTVLPRAADLDAIWDQAVAVWAAIDRDVVLAEAATILRRCDELSTATRDGALSTGCAFIAAKVARGKPEADAAVATARTLAMKWDLWTVLAEVENLAAAAAIENEADISVFRPRVELAKLAYHRATTQGMDDPDLDYRLHYIEALGEAYRGSVDIAQTALSRSKEIAKKHARDLSLDFMDIEALLHERRGRPDLAGTLYAQAVEQGPPDLASETLVSWSDALFSAGDANAQTMATRALQLSESDDFYAQGMHATATSAFCRAVVGRADAQACLRRLNAEETDIHAQQTDGVLAPLWFVRGELHLWLNQLHAANVWLTRAMAVGREGKHAEVFHQAATLLAWVHVLEGHADRAAEALPPNPPIDAYGTIRYALVRAELALLRCDARTAQAIAEKTLQRLETMRLDPGLAGHAHSVLARTLPRDAAAVHRQQALVRWRPFRWQMMATRLIRGGLPECGK